MKLNEELKQKEFESDYHEGLLNIMFTYHTLVNELNSFFKSFDITRQQYNVLRILRGVYPEPTSIISIRERMIDKMSDASRIVDRLHAKGLVVRRKNSQDKRLMDIFITDSGLELLETADKDVRNFNSFLHNLTEEEVQELNRLLDKIRE